MGGGGGRVVTDGRSLGVKREAGCWGQPIRGADVFKTLPSNLAEVARFAIITINNKQRRKEYYAKLVSQQTHHYRTQGRG